MKKSQGRAAAVVGVVAALALTACTPQNAQSGASSDTVTIAVNQNLPGNWNPSTQYWSTFSPLQEAAYETLIHATSTAGQLDPGLATTWSFDSPTDFRMTLREGVTFSDGQPFDAAAVKANIEAFRDSGGPESSNIAAVTGVDVVADHEVVVHSSTPLPDLPFYFTQTAGLMASPAALAAPDVFSQKPVGAGPYELDVDQSVAGDTYVFTKRAGYWDESSYPYKKLVVRVLTDAQASFAAIQSGQVDVAPALYQNVQAAKAGGLTTGEAGSSIMAMTIDDAAGVDVPALGDVRVRQALNYAIDREAIAGSVSPGRSTSQPLSQADYAHNPSLDDKFAYDPEKAKQLLAEAGYANGFSFQVLVTGADEVALQAFASYFAKIGVTAEIVSKPLAEFIAAATAGQYPARFSPIPVSGVPSGDIGGYILPGSGANARNYVDAPLVAAYEAAYSLTDQAARAEAFQTTFTPLLVDSSRWITAQETPGYVVSRSTVTTGSIPIGYAMPSIRQIAPAP